MVTLLEEEKGRQELQDYRFLEELLVKDISKMMILSPADKLVVAEEVAVPALTPRNSSRAQDGSEGKFGTGNL